MDMEGPAYSNKVKNKIFIWEPFLGGSAINADNITKKEYLQDLSLLQPVFDV